MIDVRHITDNRPLEIRLRDIITDEWITTTAIHRKLSNNVKGKNLREAIHALIFLGLVTVKKELPLSSGRPTYFFRKGNQWKGE